ncbi:hypothetical protein, partial [Burkholderia cepacia]
MKALDLIDFVSNSGGSLEVVDGHVRCRAPRGVLSLQIIELLKVHRDELATLLAERRVRRVNRLQENQREKPLALSFA